jgi:hypothetical protein
LSFGGFGTPTIPMMVPMCSAVVSRQLGGSTSPRDDMVYVGAGK